jgi:nucleotide-binding universal stress UspA family protein
MKNILVPMDFSDAANSALSRAIELAGYTGGRVTLLHVIFLDKIKDDLLGLDALENLSHVMSMPTGAESYTPTMSGDILRRAARERLEETAAKLAAGAKVEFVVEEGRPSAEIVDYAGKHGIDLIVMGTQGRRGLGRAFLGSVADNVIRQADCPVMVMRH